MNESSPGWLVGLDWVAFTSSSRDIHVMFICTKNIVDNYFSYILSTNIKNRLDKILFFLNLI
jgi:hypothetical protein